MSGRFPRRGGRAWPLATWCAFKGQRQGRSVGRRDGTVCRGWSISDPAICASGAGATGPIGTDLHHAVQAGAGSVRQAPRPISARWRWRISRGSVPANTIYVLEPSERPADARTAAVPVQTDAFFDHADRHLGRVAVAPASTGQILPASSSCCRRSRSRRGWWSLLKGAEATTEALRNVVDAAKVLRQSTIDILHAFQTGRSCRSAKSARCRTDGRSPVMNTSAKGLGCCARATSASMVTSNGMMERPCAFQRGLKPKQQRSLSTVRRCRRST